MPTDQDDADALFGGAVTPKPPLPTKGSDNRKETRVRANWPARVLLGGNRIVELHVFDLSESGIGLISELGIPAHTELRLALAVPGINDSARITPVTGTIKTTHMTVRGHDVHCGGTWVSLPSASRDLITQWVRKLRN